MRKQSSKMLAILVVLSMLSSIITLFAAIPTAAVAGQFDTHGKASHEVDGYDGDVNSIPGYEYTPDGFHMTTADWTTGTPFSHMSTKEKVDLKDGVYMQVRVDTFNYDTIDKWFNFNIWSKDSIDEGSGGEQFGTGVQTLIRPGSGTAEKHGTLGAIAWYTKAFKHTGSTFIPDVGRAQVDGKNVLTLVVTYHPAAGYGLTINGSAAPEKVIAYMNETYADDSEAYIGFTMYSNKKGGEQSATILKFGTNATNATKPMGDCSKDPENYYIVYDPIKDANTVPAGQPAIIMTGDKANSQLKGTPTSTTGSIISITEDSLIHVVGTRGTADCGVWNVKNDASYDIADFPVIMVMTKNFCSCGGDNGECWAYEEASVYLATGEEFIPSPSNKISGLQPYGDAYFINDDGYLIFFYDVTADLKTDEGGKFEGRINATRFDFIVDMSTPGANEFDVVMQGFFRTEEDAIAYAEQYINELNGVYGDEEETDAPVVDTEAPETNETEAPVVTETQAPATNETESTNDRYYEGFNNGYESGYDDGYESGIENGYESGYNNGFDKGYDKGYSDGVSDGYDSGYDEGFENGYESGRNEDQSTDDRYDEGFEDGFNSGLESGYNAGQADALETADDRYDEGYSEGVNDGYQEGYESGLVAGREETESVSDRYDEGFEDGYESGLAAGRAETESVSDRFDEGFENGYDVGFDAGYSKGYSNGASDNQGDKADTSSYEKGYNAGYQAAMQEIQNNANNSGQLSYSGCVGSIGSGAVILLALTFPTALFFLKRKKDE